MKKMLLTALALGTGIAGLLLYRGRTKTKTLNGAALPTRPGFHAMG